MGLIETIKITVKGLRDVTPSLFSLTNQNENKATKLVFEFENEDLKGLHKYIVFTHSNAKDRCVIFPLINDEFIVRNDISSFDGRWYIQLIMRDLEIDLNQDSIKLETLDNDEMTIVTNPIVAIVKKNTFDAEVIENLPMDENLQIVYDDLLRLKAELEEIIENGGGSSGGGTVVSGINDVKINDTSIVSNGVANIPVASGQNKHGLIQVKNAHGMMVTQEGYIYPMIASDTEIDNRTNYRWITSKNLDYAVKAAMCDGKGADWTNEEKANARNRLGLDIEPVVIEIEVTEEVRKIEVTNYNGLPLENYDFKQMWIIAESVSGLTATNNEVQIRINDSTTAGDTVYLGIPTNFTHNASKVYWCGFMDIRNGLALSNNVAVAMAKWRSNAQASINMSDLLFEENVKGIYIYSIMVDLPIGTKFKIILR